MPRVARSREHGGQGHSGRAGIMEGDEHATFPPLPGDHHPSAGHPLPDLRPHPCIPAGQHQRGTDRALPPGPSRGARHPIPVTGSRLRPARIPPRTSVGAQRTCGRSWPQARQRSHGVIGALVADAQRGGRYDRLLHRQTMRQISFRSGVMARGGFGAGPGPGTPGALGRLPGWRPHVDKRRLRTVRTARSRRSATRRPRRAGPGRSRRPALPRRGPRTGASCFAGRGMCIRARTAAGSPPGRVGRRGWPRTRSARRRRGEGGPRRGRCCRAGAAGQARLAVRRCLRRAPARQAGAGGGGRVVRGGPFPGSHTPEGRA